MNLTARFRSWLKWIVKGRRLESEMGTEVCFHIESRAADLVRKSSPRTKRCDSRGLSSAESSLTKMPCGHRWACAGGVNWFGPASRMEIIAQESRLYCGCGFDPGLSASAPHRDFQHRKCGFGGLAVAAARWRTTS